MFMKEKNKKKKPWTVNEKMERKKNKEKKKG